jgi:hypothetical protein
MKPGKRDLLKVRCRFEEKAKCSASVLPAYQRESEQRETGIQSAFSMLPMHDKLADKSNQDFLVYFQGSGNPGQGA